MAGGGREEGGGEQAGQVREPREEMHRGQKMGRLPWGGATEILKSEPICTFSSLEGWARGVREKGDLAGGACEAGTLGRPQPLPPLSFAWLIFLQALGTRLGPGERLQLVICPCG